MPDTPEPKPNTSGQDDKEAGGGGGLTVVRVPVASLHTDPGNTNTHPERNLRAIADSLASFGQVEPLVVQRGTGRVIGGNGRLEAMRAAGTAEVDVVEIEIDDTRAAALGIALNRTARLAEFDDEALARVLAELPQDLQLAAGYDEKELSGLLASVTPIVEDDAPAPLPDPVSQRGDVWMCGAHRVGCGDCTKAGDVAAVLGGTVPFLCVTDPPYGVNYDPSWRNDPKCNLAYTAVRVGEVANDDRADWSDAWALFPGSVLYSWHPAGATSLVHAAAIQGSGFTIRMQIIWAKSNFPIGRGDYHVRHEPCWYAVRDGKPANRTDDRTQTTLWEINLDKNCEGGHSTQKPVECMARPIRNHDAPEVYDPFLGSGTTLIAAEQLHRRCFGIEIEPRYVDVAVRRWEKLTSKLATLEATGKTWAETATERGVTIPQ